MQEHTGTHTHTQGTRTPKLKGVHKEAELLLGLVIGKAQVLQHQLLELPVVDTDGTATHCNKTRSMRVKTNNKKLTTQYLQCR